MSDKVISFIQPSRNNLKYLKWSYNSIRRISDIDMKYVGLMISRIGTWEWMNEMSERHKCKNTMRFNEVGTPYCMIL